MIEEREEQMSLAFPALMRKVYVWMTLALVITGVTAYGVASSPSLIYTLMSSEYLFWGCLLGELGLVYFISSRYNEPFTHYCNIVVHRLFDLEWCDDVVYLLGLHNVFDC